MQLTIKDEYLPWKRPTEPKFISPVLEHIQWAEWRFNHWKAPFGRVKDWPQMLRTNTLTVEGSQDVSLWCSQLQDAVAEGKDIVFSLHKVALVDIPKDEWDIRDVWCRAFRVMSEVLAGLSCLHWELLSSFPESQ